MFPSSLFDKFYTLARGSSVIDIFERVAAEAYKHAAYNKKSKTSVRLILPGELAKHAVSEGTMARKKCSSLTLILYPDHVMMTLSYVLVLGDTLAMLPAILKL